MHTLSFHIQEPLLAKLEALAKKQERSKGYIVRKAIAHYLEEQSDVIAAEQALQEFEGSKGKKIYSISVIKAENDL